MHASGMGYTDIVETLLKHKADINILSKRIKKFTHSALTTAIQNGHIDTVQILLNCKAMKFKLAEDNQESVLTLACKYGHTKIAKLLLESQRKLLPNENKDLSELYGNDSDGELPLSSACYHGHYECSKFLITRQQAEIIKHDKPKKRKRRHARD
eukprot:UN29844